MRKKSQFRDDKNVQRKQSIRNEGMVGRISRQVGKKQQEEETIKKTITFSPKHTQSERNIFNTNYIPKPILNKLMFVETPEMLIQYHKNDTHLLGSGEREEALEVGLRRTFAILNQKKSS